MFFEAELFHEKETEIFEQLCLEKFPWVTQVPIKDIIYMTNVTPLSFDYERDTYTLSTTVVAENQLDGAVKEFKKEEECHSDDLMEFFTELTKNLQEKGFYPDSSVNDFELEIYDWVENNKDKISPDIVFQMVISNCLKSENIFKAELSRCEFLSRFFTK